MGALKTENRGSGIEDRGSAPGSRIGYRAESRIRDRGSRIGIGIEVRIPLCLPYLLYLLTYFTYLPERIFHEYLQVGALERRETSNRAAVGDRRSELSDRLSSLVARRSSLAARNSSFEILKSRYAYLTYLLYLLTLLTYPNGFFTNWCK